MPLIEVNNLTKTYNNDGVETPALRGLSFTIKEGEFVAIMGPSGSGKSTLLHILGFLDRHTDGEYIFDDKTSDSYGDEELAHVRNKKMGFVFQAFNLLPRTTVFENVKLPLLYSDVHPSQHNEMTRKAIESVGLSHRHNHESSQLSGGEKQRVAIARALVNKPNIIFADEPTGNLDSKSGQMIMEILQKLHEDANHTIILITHETYTAEHAQRIIHILDGKIKSDTKVAKRNHAHENYLK
ncbi:ABC transporter ATP-binding protein [Patescibacteria group bacterium]|nr:ABC transporter ATP-binding protein [Patescibacteria group bacterium]MBU1954238.1 ABC transporter ATP-binding protein [Patescibacteria group bacterium]